MSYKPSPDLEIEIQFTELIKLRRKIHAELFSVDIDENTAKLILPYQGLILFTETAKSSAEFLSVSGTLNKAIIFYEKRIITHNFSDSGTWDTVNNSLFTVTPPAGIKYVIPQIVLRFPLNAVIADGNPIIFSVFLSLDGVTPVNENTPSVISRSHSSIAGLIRETNDYIGITGSIVGDLNEQNVTAVFRYADYFSLKGSPIILRAALSERIDIYMGNHQTIKDINGDTLADECTASLAVKYCMDF